METTQSNTAQRKQQEATPQKKTTGYRQRNIDWKTLEQLGPVKRENPRKMDAMDERMVFPERKTFDSDVQYSADKRYPELSFDSGANYKQSQNHPAKRNTQGKPKDLLGARNLAMSQYKKAHARADDLRFGFQDGKEKNLLRDVGKGKNAKLRKPNGKQLSAVQWFWVRPEIRLKPPVLEHPADIKQGKTIERTLLSRHRELHQVLKENAGGRKANYNGTVDQYAQFRDSRHFLYSARKIIQIPCPNYSKSKLHSHQKFLEPSAGCGVKYYSNRFYPDRNIRIGGFESKYPERELDKLRVVPSIFRSAQATVRSLTSYSRAKKIPAREHGSKEHHRLLFPKGETDTLRDAVF
ncbi:hypothetical protein FQA39_LY19366 [Lamprigera yunnana]|nr:hypothetical protein FQA39_LY19366 [Lamprigera yunnana]